MQDQKALLSSATLRPTQQPLCQPGGPSFIPVRGKGEVKQDLLEGTSAVMEALLFGDPEFQPSNVNQYPSKTEETHCRRSNSPVQAKRWGLCMGMSDR